MIIIQQYKSFKEIQDEWTMLWEKNTNASVYQSPEYVELLLRHIVNYQIIHQSSPIFFLFRKDDKIVMILPLFKRWLSNQTSLLGYKCGCGYLDAVYDDSMTECIMEECMDVFRCEYPKTLISINHVKEHTVLGKYLLKCGLNISDKPCISIHYHNSYEEYFDSLSKNMRQNIRTAYNRARNDGKEIELKSYSSGKIPADVHKNLLSIYLYRQLNRYSQFGGIFFKCFVHCVDLGTIAERELKDKETIYILSIDGEIAAFLDALHEGDTYVVPRLAINDKFYTYSPGVILLNECAKELLSNTPIRNLDLTHGDEKYKLSLGGCCHYCVEGNWPRSVKK